MMMPTDPVAMAPQLDSPTQPVVAVELAQAFKQNVEWNSLLDIDMLGLMEDFGELDDSWLDLQENELQIFF